MIQQWYKRTTEAAMKGMRVRSIVPLRNGLMEAPVGTVFTIVGKRAAGHLLDGETWQQFPEVAGVPG